MKKIIAAIVAKLKQFRFGVTALMACLALAEYFHILRLAKSSFLGGAVIFAAAVILLHLLKK